MDLYIFDFLTRTHYNLFVPTFLRATKISRRFIYIKKKNLLLALATTLCVSCAFVGCGSKDEDNNSTTEAKENTTRTKENSSETKEENSILGYWETKDTLIPSYYHFTEDKMDAIILNVPKSADIEITESEITVTVFGESSTSSYTFNGDILIISHEGETTELGRISEEDYNEILASLESANGSDQEDPGVNGYVVEPGVEMTITEDDGTVIVYANDGNGTYIKSTTPPTEDAEE